MEEEEEGVEEEEEEEKAVSCQQLKTNTIRKP